MGNDINGQSIDPNDTGEPLDTTQPENVAAEVLALGLAVQTDASATALINAIQAAMAASAASSAPLATAQAVIAAAAPFLKLISPVL